jgi:hypothetical protein
MEDLKPTNQDSAEHFFHESTRIRELNFDNIPALMHNVEKRFGDLNKYNGMTSAERVVALGDIISLLHKAAFMLTFPF